MTLEAAAGKNPVNHVGKLYAVLAERIAAAVAGRLGAGGGAECLMLSQIGRPIYDPQLVDLRVRPAAGTSASALEPMAAGAVRDELARIADVREQLIAERIVPY